MSTYEWTTPTAGESRYYGNPAAITASTTGLDAEIADQDEED